MSELPTLFVSHGAPTLALDPGATGAALCDLASRLPRPRAILVVSAHWETRVPVVSAVPMPQVMHDFHGFPDALYRLDYRAPGAPDLAARVVDLLDSAGVQGLSDSDRGLDHGAWVPLRLMYPDASIPVTQLSIQPVNGPAWHYRVGRALTALRQEGVLVIGSGSLTHNLVEFRGQGRDAAERPYVTEFRRWMAHRLGGGDVEQALEYRTLAPHAVRAHPTEEHLLPLFSAWGAAGTRSSFVHLHPEAHYGILAMDIFAFGTEGAVAAARAPADAVAA
jgi:4,5-DOPA dioxygenase extradiol